MDYFSLAHCIYADLVCFSTFSRVVVAVGVGLVVLSGKLFVRGSSDYQPKNNRQIRYDCGGIGRHGTWKNRKRADQYFHFRPDFRIRNRLCLRERRENIGIPRLVNPEKFKSELYQAIEQK